MKTDISVELRAFNSARTRCNNPHAASFAYYGGRGIEFRFNDFDEFFKEVGKRPSHLHSLDRIDNDGHYEKGNVRWATKKEQIANRRTADPSRNRTYLSRTGVVRRSIVICIDEHLYQAIKAISKAEDRSVSNTVGRVLKSHLLAAQAETAGASA